MEEKTEEKVWHLYILGSCNPDHKNSTYIGITNDIEKRLRQHNKEIKGGAKCTKSKGPWQHILYMTGFSDKVSVMQAEWKLKNMSRLDKHYWGPVGRISSLKNALLHLE